MIENPAGIIQGYLPSGQRIHCRILMLSVDVKVTVSDFGDKNMLKGRRSGRGYRTYYKTYTKRRRKVKLCKCLL